MALPAAAASLRTLTRTPSLLSPTGFPTAAPSPLRPSRVGITASANPIPTPRSARQGHIRQSTREGLPLRAVAAPAAEPQTTLATPPQSTRTATPENIRTVTSLSDFERQMGAAKAQNQLLVVEFTKLALPNAQKGLQTMVDLSSTTPDVVFARVFADQSEELRSLFVENEVKQIPSYAFFRNGQKVHVAAGIRPDRLKEEVLYYGQAEYPVHQLESREELEALLQVHDGSERLVVVQVTLNFCGPCVKVYPAVLQMSHKMAGSAVFARLFGDHNRATEQFLSDLGILEAPTFLFYRDNQLLGRYVGSGKGELVGEVLRYQGVQCT